MCDELSTTVLLIAGMKNNGCREIVAGALQIVRGVRDVHVNLYRAKAIVTHELHCDAADLIDALKNAGYGASQAPGGNGMILKDL